MAISTAAAIIIGSVVAGGSAVVAANKGADAVTDASTAGITAQERALNTILGLTEPGRQIGNEALNTLGSAFIPGFEGVAGFDPINQGDLADIFKNLPGTQFEIDQAEKAVGNSFASRGGAFGGNAIRALGDRTGEIASSRVTNNLLQLAGFGPQATATASSAAANTGNNISGLLQGAGFAQQQGFQNAGAGINNAIQGGLNNFLLMQALGQT